MKKIVSKSLQTALLRGAVAVSGSLCTAMAVVFCNSIYGVVVTLFLGAAIVALIDEAIINNLNKKYYED